jgi:hypothetical protein
MKCFHLLFSPVFPLSLPTFQHSALLSYMNINRITDSLNRLFHEEGRRIVFRFDPDQEFIQIVPDLSLGD